MHRARRKTDGTALLTRDLHRKQARRRWRLLTAHTSQAMSSLWAGDQWIENED